MPTIYTIGHSTRTIEEFISLLEACGIRRLVDIRKIPRSRRNPQFEQAALKKSLEAAGIAYAYEERLGGRRPSRQDSPNTGWRNKSFQNYADHMQTAEFRQGVRELVTGAKTMPTAIMCAEAVPWRCHRSLVADALLARGAKVLDIMTLSTEKEHALTSFARVRGKEVTYPPPEAG